MTGTVTDLAVRSLAGLVDLDVERTQYRGHARELAAAARAELVIVHGGDGSINEVVNGVMGRVDGGAARRPLIAVIPGGGANVLARALGLPLDAAAAIRRVREVIAAGRYRTIGLGLAADRYFTFSAGLGMDAEVVREVDGCAPRAAGKARRCSCGRWCASITAAPTGAAGPDPGTRRRATDQRPVHDHHYQPLAVDLFPRPPAAARS